MRRGEQHPHLLVLELDLLALVSAHAHGELWGEAGRARQGYASAVVLAGVRSRKEGE